MRHWETYNFGNYIRYGCTRVFYFHESSLWLKRTPLKLFLDNYLWHSEELFLRILPKLLFYRSSRPGVFCKKSVFLWILRNCKNTFFYRTPPVAASISTSYEVIVNEKLIHFIRKTEPCIFRYCLRLRLISKTFIKRKVSLGVPLLDLCYVIIATQLSNIP